MRGVIIGVLYIISQERYYNYYRQGIFKYIPNKIIPTTKPKILDNLYNKQEEVIGRVGGVFLNDLNRDESLLAEKLIYGIEKLKDTTINSLILEEMNLLDEEDIKLIEKNTGLKLLDGRNILIQALPSVLKVIYKRMGKNLQEKEILIISDEEILTKKTIELLYDEVQFITLIGENEQSIESVSEYILGKTGLSIFNSKDIGKILKNYPIIINFKEEVFIDLNKIRRDSLIFDFSIGKEISKIKGRSIVIKDLLFEVEDVNIKENIWIEKLVPSHFYEYLYTDKFLDVKGLLDNEDIYEIEEFIRGQMLKKGRL